MTKKPAKNEDIKLLKAVMKLRDQGKSIKAIAKALHKSDRTIADIVKRSGTCPAPQPTMPPCVGKECPNLTDQVVALRSKGLSIKEIAKKFHKSDKKVAAIVKKTGIGAPAKKPIPPKGVPGFDVIKIELNKDQQFALFVAAHIMELADEINKVIAKVFNKGN